MALCYLILSQNRPDFLSDLLRYLHRQDDYFIIHIDEKANTTMKNQVELICEEFGNIISLPRELCSWGGYSLVDATLRAMRQACDKSCLWTHFLLISEQHVPLRSPEAIKDVLEEDKSYFVTYPMSEFTDDGLEDLLQRFHRNYQELPGVGGFPCGIRETSDIPQHAIFHAPQWTVLARNACLSILRLLTFDNIEFFKSSLLPDETAIPSLFMKDASLERKAEATTFVAYPHLTDNNDQILSDACFEAALASGMLFARKRPATLTPAMIKFLESIASTRHEEFSGRLQARKIKKASASIRERMLGLIGRGSVAAHAMQGNHISRVYLHFSTEFYPRNYRTYLISEDCTHFKVCSCGIHLDSDCEALIEKDGFTKTMLRVRLNDVHSWSEIHLNTNSKFDFFTCSEPGDFQAMADAISQHVDYAENLEHRRRRGQT